MPEDRMASFRANNQRAIAALEAVAAYAQTRPWQTSSLPAGADPERDRERLSRVLCGLRHLSDQFYGLCFHQIRSTADELYKWARTALPDPSAGAACCRSGHRHLRTRSRPPRCGGRAASGPWTSWRSSTATTAAAASRGRQPSPGSPPGSLASLRQYADRQGLDFGSAMAAGLRAHAQQCLSAYGPIDTGLVPDRRPGAGPDPVSRRAAVRACRHPSGRGHGPRRRRVAAHPHRGAHRAGGTARVPHQRP